MKKYIVLIVAIAIGFSACQKAMEEITELHFERIFIPTGLEVVIDQVPSATTPTIMQLTTTFRWNRSSNPDVTTYRLQFIADSAFPEDPNDPNITTIEVDNMTTFSLPQTLPFDVPFAARVMAIAPEGADEGDSKWHEIAFQTPHENLFMPFAIRAVRSRMATLRWHISDVTRVTVAASGQPTINVPFPAEAIENGTFTLTDLNPSTTYTVTLFRGLQRRGLIQFTTNPGFSCADTANVLCLPLDGDLRAAMEDPANIGRVILLPPGFETTITGEVAIAGTMHIFGDADADELPRITFSSTGATPRLFRLPTDAEHLILENVEIIGTETSYIINQAGTEPMTLGTLRLENVVLNSFGSGGIRLQGGGQTINNVIINNIVASGIGGFVGAFGFIQVNQVANIENIEITNSTFFNVRIFIDMRQRTADHVNHVTIEDVTFDRLVGFPDESSRWFIDFRNQPAAGGPNQAEVVIRNTIFGSTQSFAGARGIGIRPDTPPAEAGVIVEGSFRTNDWVTHGPQEVAGNPVNFDVPNLSVFNGGREQLFRNPNNGDFTIIGTGAIQNIGDPRWRP
ncbi:MAG: DUF5123 domain-containing protein [Bacteroidales bacterium]|nr:DUF5123 domain-containing protein [Bacteroidales bacterium]